jgi:hypothetical protein
MNTTTLREVWNGHAVELAERWRLRKRNEVCCLWSHEFGLELRLEIGELFRTQVCRSAEEILETQEAWKAAVIEKGRAKWRCDCGRRFSPVFSERQVQQRRRQCSSPASYRVAMAR